MSEYIYLIHVIDNEFIVEKYLVGLQTNRNVINRVLYLAQFNTNVTIYKIMEIRSYQECSEWIKNGVFTDEFYEFAYYAANMEIKKIKRQIFEHKLLKLYTDEYICNPLALIKYKDYIYDYVLFNYLKRIPNTLKFVSDDIIPGHTSIVRDELENS